MRVPLVSGAYQNRSIIAGAQRCVNLYPESAPDDSQAPVPVTHYPTPGLRLLGAPPNIAVARCLYRATSGDVYVVVDTNVYFVDNEFTFTLLGNIEDGNTTVSMADNGLVIVIVDGTPNGYCIDMTTGDRTFAQIQDPSFYGADRVDYLDTFFILNRPGTAQFYISLSEVTAALLTGGVVGTGAIAAPGSGGIDGVYDTVALTGGSGSAATANITVSGGIVTAVALVDGGLIDEGGGYRVGDVLSADPSTIGGTVGFEWTVASLSGGSAFDPEDIASKTGSADNIVSLIVSVGQILLIGSLGSEVFVNTGASDFTFARLPGALIEHGCVAKYSVAKQDTAAFWLSSDREGEGIVIKAVGSQIERISTHAIESVFQAYSKISDAIGYCFQQQGHAFYVLAFPSADATWAYELQTGQWHELASLDVNGNLRRHRANCCCFAYGMNIIGDWQNGQLYALDPNVFTDNGAPVVRIRTFPHMIQDGKRVFYARFIADMQVGTLAGTLLANPPEVSLRWSDTRGASYGNPVKQAIGSAGDFLRSILWTRLGTARDRVFELSWSAPVPTALNGAFVELETRSS